MATDRRPSAIRKTAPPSRPAGDGDALFRAVVEAALDAIVVIDRSGAIQSANKAAEQIFDGLHEQSPV